MWYLADFCTINNQILCKFVAKAPQSESKKIMRYFTSKNVHSKADEYVACCVCGVQIKGDNDVLNLHLNACLERRCRNDSLSGADSVKTTNMQSSFDQSQRGQSFEDLESATERFDNCWTCIVCNYRMTNDNDYINLHLNACLAKQAHAPCAKDATLPVLPVEDDASDEDHDELAEQKSNLDGKIKRVKVNSLESTSNTGIKDALTPRSDRFGEVVLPFSRPIVCHSSSQQAEEPFLTINQCVLTLVPGLIIIRNFITEREEVELLRSIDGDPSTPWQLSARSGKCDSKAFGVRTQFGIPRSNSIVMNQSIARGTSHKYSSEIRGVRRNDQSAGEMDLPPYTEFIIKRFQDLKSEIVRTLSERIRLEALHRVNSRVDASQQQPPSPLGSVNFSAPCLQKLKESMIDFIPNECNMNSYYQQQGHYLKAHVDDRQLSGPILMNLSLGGRAIMRYSKPSTGNSTQYTQHTQHTQLNQQQHLRLHQSTNARDTISESAIIIGGNSVSILNEDADEHEVESNILVAKKFSGCSNGFDVDAGKQWIDVPLEPRCLQLIAGEGRYKWEHEIKKQDLLDPRRVSITWRGAGIIGKNKSTVML